MPIADLQIRHLKSEQLLADSIELAFNVMASGFRPDLLIALWRGGTPIGIAMQEVFACLGIECQHYPIRSSSYQQNGQQNTVQLWGLELLQPHLQNGSRVLLVDDVFDTGRTLHTVCEQLRSMTQPAELIIKLATPWFKPASNLTPILPDYHLHETAEWLVFPHELQGLTAEQLLAKPGLAAQMEKLLILRKGD